MSFTKPMWFFGIKKRDLTNITQEARKACSDKREILCFDRLDNGYSTSYTVYDDAGNYAASIAGGDSVAMFSASHTREDGGTAWNNIVYDGKKMLCHLRDIFLAIRYFKTIKLVVEF